MPSKKNNNRSMLPAQSKQVRSQGAPAAPGKKKKKSAKRGGGQRSNLTPYMRMLNDPCNAPLVPGLYGTMEGYLSRFHQVLNVQPAVGLATMTAGVVLWCPKFHNPGNYGATPAGPIGGISGAEYNLITIQTDNPAVGLDLTGFNISAATVLTPGATFNDGRSLSSKDPAWTFVNGGTCSSARTLSACMRMSYFGQMSTTQGMVARIDMPLSQLLDAILAAGSTNMYDSNLTVDGLFATSQKVGRVSLDTIEQKWIPSEDGLFLGGVTDTAVRDIDGDFMLSVAKGGTPGGSTTSYSIGRYASVNNPRVIGFAWRGLATATAPPFQFDLYKNIEWKPQNTSGITVPRSVRNAVIPPVQSALVALDAKGHSWTQEVMQEAESVASSVVKTALAFSGQLATKALGI